MKLTCAVCSGSTWRISTTRGPTSPSMATLPDRARSSHRAGGGSSPSRRSVVSITDTAAPPEHRRASSLWTYQPASRRATLGAARQPRRLSKNTALRGGLSIHPPIAGRSAEMASGRDDLIDRHTTIRKKRRPTRRRVPRNPSSRADRAGAGAGRIPGSSGRSCPGSPAPLRSGERRRSPGPRRR